MRRIPHRHLRAYLRYFDRELNEPVRSDYYLMQIAREVHCVIHSAPQTIKLKDFNIKFGLRAKPKWSPEFRKLQSDLAKAQWFARLGLSDGEHD